MGGICNLFGFPATLGAINAVSSTIPLPQAGFRYASTQAVESTKTPARECWHARHDMATAIIVQRAWLPPISPIRFQRPCWLHKVPAEAGGGPAGRRPGVGLWLSERLIPFALGDQVAVVGEASRATR